MSREPPPSSTPRALTARARRASHFWSSATHALGEAARRARRELAALWQFDPGLRPLLLAFMAVQVIAMFWDQPGFYGWENDGAAPRGLFGGIAENLTPGKADRYPLFHYVLLAFAALPVLLTDAVVAAATGQSLMQAVISVPSMTAIALSAKLLHAAMLGVTLLALCRVFATAFDRSTGRWAVAFALVNLSVGYYGRVTNVDAAYLLWVTLFVDRLSILTREPGLIHQRLLAFFAAAAVATKDQAYASLALPALLYWAVLRQGAARSRGSELARTIGLAAGFYAMLSGAVFNPSGFWQRIVNLLGPNSQDWRQYEASATGLLANVRDLFALQDDFWWPWPCVVAAWIGVVIAPIGARDGARAEPKPRHWSHGWLPLCAGAGSVLLFALPVGRAEHRFMLPLGFWLSGYLGLAIASLGAWSGGASRWPALAGGVLFLLGLGHALELLVTQWCDPRRDVERYLATLAPGTEVETYGLGVYLPRFDLSADSTYRVTRVNALGSGTPPPIRGLREIKADFAELERRKPDLLVIPEGFAARFRSADRPEAPRRRAMDVYRAAAGAQQMFQSALTDRVANYRLLEVGEVRLPEWYRWLGGEALSVHGSTGRRVWVYRRVTPAQLESSETSTASPKRSREAASLQPPPG